jgi:hypothetical protein
MRKAGQRGFTLALYFAMKCIEALKTSDLNCTFIYSNVWSKMQIY